MKKSTSSQRPTMLMSDAEMDAVKAQAAGMVDAYHASVLMPIERKSGFVVYLTMDGQPYTIVAGCECPADRITVYNDPRHTDHPGERTVNLVCAMHGQHPTIAEQVQPVRYNKAAYAWVEQRFARDRRVQWGMSRQALKAVKVEVTS